MRRRQGRARDTTGDSQTGERPRVELPCDTLTHKGFGEGSGPGGRGLRKAERAQYTPASMEEPEKYGVAQDRPID